MCVCVGGGGYSFMHPVFVQLHGSQSKHHTEIRGEMRLGGGDGGKDGGRERR